jgi:hypothetical protein
MNVTVLVSTRKGLFWVRRKNGNRAIEQIDFLGDNVTLTLTDHRSGRHYAALDHGHFGVKLHRSTATGWEEVAAPAYPPKPEGVEENDMGAVRSHGTLRASGRCRPAGPTNRAWSGAARCPVVCFVPPIMATAGR